MPRFFYVIINPYPYCHSESAIEDTIMIETILCIAISKELVYSKIIDYSEYYEVPESVMSYVISHEAAKTSKGDFLPCGDGDTHLIDPLGKPHRSMGIAQINQFFNPTITPEQAYDIDFALTFLAKEIKEGRCSRWTTCRNYQKNFPLLFE